MLTSITPKGMFEYLKMSPFRYCKISSARIGATVNLLERYEEQFAGDVNLLSFYQQFIVSRYANGLMKLAVCDSVDLVDNCLSASRIAGKNLVDASDGASFVGADVVRINDYGVRILSPLNPVYDGVQDGITPFEMHVLMEGGICTPGSKFGRIIIGSESLVFYDKCVNASSCALISQLLSYCSPGANVVVIRGAGSRIDVDGIFNSVDIPVGVSLVVETATLETCRLFHDRFCYIDDQYEVHFPRGLDCFGGSPHWQNKNSIVYVHDSSHGVFVDFCFESGGSASVRSVVNKI